MENKSIVSSNRYYQSISIQVLCIVFVLSYGYNSYRLTRFNPPLLPPQYGELPPPPPPAMSYGGGPSLPHPIDGGYGVSQMPPPSFGGGYDAPFGGLPPPPPIGGGYAPPFSGPQIPLPPTWFAAPPSFPMQTDNIQYAGEPQNQLPVPFGAQY